ncbi:hypothetical protein ACFC09_14395 [Streptomyces sp. NPDC056161]|uniref:hypothetical protein n=1 Tax=Streptomyces sp. NPDC056161 TaxID=3345732 RepID=UPI0035D5D9C4
MTDTQHVINQLRCQIAIMGDLLRLAAQCGEWDTHAKYKAMRRDLSGELHGAVDAALDEGTLTRQQASRGLSPIASPETARVF